jgi:hypothetical protein
MTQATESELKGMCENLIELRGEIDLSEESVLVANVEEDFKKERKRLLDWKARDLKGWDDELAAELKNIEDDEEKKKLTEEYAKKKEITASRHDPGIDALDGKKTAAIEAAKKKVVENKAAFEKAVAECVTEAQKEGISQKMAQCRIKADSADKYWNSCR